MKVLVTLKQGATCKGTPCFLAEIVCVAVMLPRVCATLCLMSTARKIELLKGQLFVPYL